MGAAFILGGLGFAVVGGLLYYFLSNQEAQEQEQPKDDSIKELLETHQQEVRLF
jgi:hypothetical protein